MDAFQESMLTNGGDCPLHFHMEDRRPTHDTLSQLNSQEKYVTLTATASIAEDTDYVLTSGTATLTLPRAKGGTKVTFIKTSAAGTTTIAAPSGSTINGAASVTLTSQWQTATCKELGGAYYVC